jgi:hypothetical protein
LFGLNMFLSNSCWSFSIRILLWRTEPRVSNFFLNLVKSSKKSAFFQGFRSKFCVHFNIYSTPLTMLAVSKSRFSHEVYLVTQIMQLAFVQFFQTSRNFPFTSSLGRPPVSVLVFFRATKFRTHSKPKVC